MPRRKQQAPRRSAAYVPEEELKAAEIDEEAVEEDGLSLDVQDGEYVCNEEAEIKEAQSYQNSPVSTATNQDAGYGSPFSENSDQLVHFKSSSSREGKEDPQGPDGVSYPQDSLAQIKAVYANLFSESCWSSLALDLKKSASTTSSNDVGPKESSTPAPTPPTSTAGPTGTTASTPSSGSGSGSGSGTGGSGGSGYDWHQAALAKTLQQTSSYGLLPEPSLFSTVQLYRQNNKLYGSVFTGASKFRCRDCSAAYDTLVELTVHMNETGHYRDDNRDKDSEKTKRWSKPRKRSLMEMEGKEDAQKVLKCMYCGHSFESLQDLSVHMIKTKHYQKVPLKEPVPAIAKLVPSTKKRALQDLASPCSPEPAGPAADAALGEAAKDQKAANPYVTPNNRYGYQNGASYTWQFEARKAQILKCMECGSSHDTLQQLTAHMMVTGHFLKVTTSASKKGKQLALDPVAEEKIQSIPLPPTTHTRLPASHVKKQPDSPAASSPAEEKKEPEREKAPAAGEAEKKVKEESQDAAEKFEPTALYRYLREEDLDDSPKGGVDILKSLENTVSTAISKAQNGAPSWGGYPSIHAAYQLPGTVKPLPAVQSVQMQPSYAGGVKSLSSEHSALLHSPGSLTPPPHKSNVSAMEELVEKVTGKASVKKEERPADREKGSPAKAVSPVAKENKDLPRAEESGGKVQQKKGPEAEAGKAKKEGVPDAHTPNGTEPLRAKVTNGCNNLGIITDHSPEPSFINPLSALQSIMNTHLGKVSKPASPSLDPLAMLYKISNSMLDKPVYPATPAKQADAIDRYYYENSDQPIDLTKSKSKPLVSGAADAVASPLRESALMDISDMVKNLTGRLTPKSSTPSTVSEKSDADGSSFEEALDELSPVHKRKGRQSNWNPQHLLILQAQFASSLRETPEGKYIMADLGPQERVHISKFTGLSMTTISHWLANVKYQLRRTGGTKFLKNLDTGHPVFFCNDCASQFRTASTYINHLETHLGFSLKDLSKLPLNQIQEQQNVSKVLANKALGPVGAAEDDLGSTFQCKLCNRTFASKHAVKLHLSKTHGKSPEDHLIYVTELEKQ
ncbi:LOW QUALITY PROTEIN: teashirt homolog 1 [Panthera pardus]|uniref:LOW QUALITY PROTEIN: teashirt homolog 1 n=1 Tax=Panthera pardus TaxID=9691 RepID=A0A9W2VJM3_PANPR|nr:LOW QUALITY PROTEIN: teashirt homolog 1 [Panthera pardus]